MFGDKDSQQVQGGGFAPKPLENKTVVVDAREPEVEKPVEGTGTTAAVQGQE